MNITLLCNAGLMLEQDGQVLLIDAPNSECPPYYRLSDREWADICAYKTIIGLYFTHDHPDHYDRTRADQLLAEHFDIPVFLPEDSSSEGTLTMGPFELSYRSVAHAPLPQAPAHVVTWVKAGDMTLYLPADAALDAAPHRQFLGGRKADIGIWNAMYLSRPETRALMHDAARKNYIYHMPLEKDDQMGIWRKCRSNFRRAHEELCDICVLEQYPSKIV